MNLNSFNLKKQNQETVVDVSAGVKTVEAVNIQKSEMQKNSNQGAVEKIKAFLNFKKKAQIASQTTPSSQKLEFLTEEIAGVKIPNKILFTLIVAAIGSLIFAFGFYFFLSIFGQKIKTTIDNLQNKIKSLRQETVLNLEIKKDDTKEAAAQVEAIYAIMANRTPWVEILNNLETYTLPSVYYQGLTLDSGGKYTFAAQAESFADIINQAEIYKSASNFVKKVEVSNLKLVTVKKEELNKPAELAIENEAPSLLSQAAEQPEQYVEFNISLELAPEFFPAAAITNQPSAQPPVLTEPFIDNQENEQF